MEFEQALQAWKAAQDDYVAKREAYRTAYAAAYIASNGKTADLKMRRGKPETTPKRWRQ